MHNELKRYFSNLVAAFGAKDIEISCRIVL